MSNIVKDTTSNEINSIECNTDELMMHDISSSDSAEEQIADFELSSSSCSRPISKTIDQFLTMGFPKEMVVKAVKENGENDKEAVLEALLTYSDMFVMYTYLKYRPLKNHQMKNLPFMIRHSETESNFLDAFFDEEIGENEESTDPLVEKGRTVSYLVEMGYQAENASEAIDRCGINIPIIELVEFIEAAKFAYDTNALLGQQSYEKEPRFYQQPRLNDPDHTSKDKRKFHEDGELKLKKLERLRKQSRYLEKRPTHENDEVLHLPNPMIGFGIPNAPLPVIQRRIPDEAQGGPFFYYENVALTPKGVWSTISRFLYDIKPEFVDSKFFCAAARKRGYIHNLPIHNRFQLLPSPPSSIHEALPDTKEFWPSWDARIKLNCLLTCVGSAKLTDKIKKAVENSGDEPSPGVKKYIIEQCKKWNLIWVGKNKVAPLEPNEMELLMGFPVNHTRGGGITRAERYTALGNAFQVDTVAYHLSVLKNISPNGINVLSLFSGIGGAEVALHRLGIPLKNVVSVEISDACRCILQTWWEQTNQQGNLIHFPDVEMVTASQVEEWMSEFGGFDLIIGGSPCNNLAGGNRHTRHGLGGAKSSLFFEYYRITNLVRSIMRHST